MCNQGSELLFKHCSLLIAFLEMKTFLGLCSGRFLWPVEGQGGDRGRAGNITLQVLWVYLCALTHLCFRSGSWDSLAFCVPGTDASQEREVANLLVMIFVWSQP